MTLPLFLDDAYRRTAPARVTKINDRGGIVLDQSLFYATSGGQPGDSGGIDGPGAGRCICPSEHCQSGAEYGFERYVRD